jgi:cysteine-rich repeat protein
MRRSQEPLRLRGSALVAWAVASLAVTSTACLPGDLVPDAGDVGPLDVGDLDTPAMTLPDVPITDFIPDAYVLDTDAPVSPPDAAVDCELCAPADPCFVLVCEGSCSYDPLPDGSECMAGFVCVDALCVAPGCGNGWREAGEGCDDGNLVDGDGCDVMCAPEVITVDESLSGMQAVVGAAAAGMDDAGNLLVAWVVDRPGADPTENTALLAQRFDRRGRAIDEVPVELDTAPSTNPPLAAVVPLSRGWALAWPSNTVDEQGIAYLVASPSGAYPAPRCAHAPTSHPEVEPTLARTDAGFVIGWQSRFGFQLHVRARRFDRVGTPLGDEFAVTSPDVTSESLPVLYGRASYVDSEDDETWSLAYVGGTPAGQVLFASFDGERAVGSPVRRVFHLPADLVVLRGTDGVLVGTQTVADRGTVNLRWLEDGAPDIDTEVTDLVTFGGRAIDEDLAVASVPGEGSGEWLALWRSSNTDTRPLGVATSSGAAPLPALSRLEEAMSGVWEIEDISVGRAGPRPEDGWIVTYIAITDTTHRLNLFRLTF